MLFIFAMNRFQSSRLFSCRISATLNVNPKKKTSHLKLLGTSDKTAAVSGTVSLESKVENVDDLARYCSVKDEDKVQKYLVAFVRSVTAASYQNSPEPTIAD